MKLTEGSETKESLISIVDDEACVRESLSSLIRSVGYRAKEYVSAEDFLTSGRSDEPACLILDVSMPGMDGLELQRRLAETGRQIPIVFLSALASEEEERRALRAGAADFLRKPVSEGAVARDPDRTRWPKPFMAWIILACIIGGASGCGIACS